MTDETKATDDPKPMTVHYFSMELSNGREVWMGYNHDDKADHGYFFHFKNGDVVTKLRLSDEALAAVIKLKPEVDMARDVGEVIRWTLKVDASGAASEIAEAT